MVSVCWSWKARGDDMTVQNSNVKNIYIGNGSTTSFPFTFPCSKAEYIKVFVRKNNLIAQTDDFTVDLDNATVTYPKSGTPLAAGETLVILRELPLEQPLNLVNQGPFFAEDIETTLDEEVMMIQQLREQLGRSLTVPVDIDAENAFETSVPIKPGMSFRVKDDGSGFEETDDPARVLPLASDALKKAEAARDVAIAKADAAGTSAVSAAESEVAADRSATQAEAAKTNAKASEVAAKASQDAAKVSETNAKASETVATAKASEASVSATKAKTSETNAKASETAAKTSETNAKSSETSASNSAKSASTSATTATQQASKATTEANRAKTEADRAKTAADSVGNPVVSITQSNGNLTVTKGDGSSDTLTVTPAVATKTEAEAGTENSKLMTPLRVKEAITKNLEGYVPTTDVGNAANKIPKYNSSGHLVLPSGAEFWIS